MGIFLNLIWYNVCVCMIFFKFLLFEDIQMCRICMNVFTLESKKKKLCSSWFHVIVWFVL